MTKTYAIGDLHGRFDLLTRALSMIEADAGDEGGTFIVLGDFVDRGPQSRSIIDLLMHGPSLPNWKWIVLQGNHEAMMLEALCNPSRLLPWWIGNGGGETLRSFGYEQGDTLQPLKISPEQLEWLADLPLVAEDAHRIYVHAGVPYDKPLTECAPETLQWMLYGKEGASEADLEGWDDDTDGRQDGEHCSGKHIVHGHHQSATHPLLLKGRTNLDSFAWNSNRLAIGVFDSERAGGPVKIMDAIAVARK